MDMLNITIPGGGVILGEINNISFTNISLNISSHFSNQLRKYF